LIGYELVHRSWRLRLQDARLAVSGGARIRSSSTTPEAHFLKLTRNLCARLEPVCKPITAKLLAVDETPTRRGLS